MRHLIHLFRLLLSLACQECNFLLRFCQESLFLFSRCFVESHEFSDAEMPLMIVLFVRRGRIRVAGLVEALRAL